MCLALRCASSRHDGVKSRGQPVGAGMTGVLSVGCARLGAEIAATANLCWLVS